MTSTDSKPVEILLVEDNPGDARLTEKALQQGKILNTLHVVEDGVEAMKYLRGEDEYSDQTRPDLVLLDLNLPRKGGKEVLAEMKRDSDLRRIPVIVLTSSEAEEDIVKSYDLNANAYLTKPVDFSGFLEVIERFEDFWLCVVRIPPN